jgi:hypothetical protein
LSQLFLIEEQSVGLLVNVMNESDGQKSAPVIDFHHRLFEIVIDFDYECGGWLLLVKRTQTNNMLFEAPPSTISSVWKI